MSCDLHNHSTCSDGSVPIHRLPLMAARAGLDTMLHSYRQLGEGPALLAPVVQRAKELCRE